MFVSGNNPQLFLLLSVPSALLHIHFASITHARVTSHLLPERINSYVTYEYLIGAYRIELLSMHIADWIVSKVGVFRNTDTW